MTPERLARHPIVVAALDRHGLTPQDVIDSPEWRRHEHIGYYAGNSMNLPEIDVAKTFALLKWESDDSGQPVASFHIERISGVWHHRVRISQTMPETMAAAAIGRPLRDLVDIEGSEGIMITAVQHGDGLQFEGTLLTVTDPTSI